MTVLRFAILGALAFGCLLPVPVQADVQKSLQTCGGKLCPSYEIAITPPEDWQIDRTASEENRAQMLVPIGSTFHDARAVIYVRVSPKGKEQPLADFIRVSQDLWRQSVSDTKIQKLPVVERDNGKAAFEPFRYESPSQPQQPFEVVAFGIGSDKDGNDFIITVVMSSKDQKALEQAQPAFLALLRRH